MGISVEGQKCPVCNSYLFDSDDVVFCPECGAPHHRECYNSVGHCALEQYHGTENQYERPKPKEPKENIEKGMANGFDNTQPQLNSESFTGGPQQRVCSNCGAIYNAGEQACPKCGAQKPLVVNAFGMPVPIDPLGGIKKEAETDGITATEAMNYVRLNTPRYIPKFFSLNKKNKISWNWGAFIFPQGWFFYRKINFPGALFFLLTLISSIFVSAIGFIENGIPQEVLNGTYSDAAKYITDNISSINMTPFILAFLGVAIGLVTRIFAALFADWLYKKDAVCKVKAIKEKTESTGDEYALELRKKGGVSLWLSLLGIMSVQWIVILFYTLL